MLAPYWRLVNVTVTLSISGPEFSETRVLESEEGMRVLH